MPIVKQLDLENVTFINTDGVISLEVKKEYPEYFYKYYSLSQYSNANMKEGSLFFSHAHLLNDVMDGSFSRWNVDEFIAKYKADTQLEIDKKQILLPLVDSFLAKRGTLSLTESYENELFWAHYSNDRGYCIRLNSNKLKAFLEEKFEKDLLLFPINYTDLEALDFHDKVIYTSNGTSVSFDANLPILSSFAEKNKFWSYENEWRFFLRHNEFENVSHPLYIIEGEQKSLELSKLKNRNVLIDLEIIEKVILSVYFFNNNRFSRYIGDQKTETFWFNSENEGTLTLAFLRILKEQYSDRIEQIEVITTGKFHRKVMYSIEIIELTDDYVKIRRADL